MQLQKPRRCSGSKAKSLLYLDEPFSLVIHSVTDRAKEGRSKEAFLIGNPGMNGWILI